MPSGKDANFVGPEWTGAGTEVQQIEEGGLQEQSGVNVMKAFFFVTDSGVKWTRDVAWKGLSG